MAKNLTQLTARTATADSDLLHINSGGTDYKETKINFLKGSFGIEFSNTTDITTQADTLPETGTYYGTLISSGHQTETGTPLATFWYVRILCLSAYYKVIDLWGVDDPQANHYIKCKKNNTWRSAWTLDPTRSEITSLNNSLTNSALAGTNAITLASGYSGADVSEIRLYKNNKTVVAYIQIGSLNLSAGANNIGTVANGYRPTAWTSNVGSMGGGGDNGTPVRVVIATTGALWVYASSAIGSTLRITITYITN